MMTQIGLCIRFVPRRRPGWTLSLNRGTGTDAGLARTIPGCEINAVSDVG